MLAPVVSAFQIRPRWLQERPRGSQEAPRCLQDDLLGRQVAPRWSQDGAKRRPRGSKWRQEEAKRLQNEPSWLQHGAQNAQTSQSKNNEKPWVFIAFFASGRAKMAPRSLQNDHLGPSWSQVAAGQVLARAQGQARWQVRRWQGAQGRGRARPGGRSGPGKGPWIF